MTAEGFAWPTTSRTVATAFATLALVTALSHGLPGDYANVAVAAAFLGVTWLVVLRQDPLTVRAYGVSLAGLFEPDEMDWRQLVREAARSLGWVLLFALIFFPPFAFGFDRVWAAHKSFALRVPSDWLDRASGQLLVVALPEELFFRGYLQSALDGRWGTRWRILGAELGLGWLAASAIFALGHVLTIAEPGRLAVFFPALAFGWLRARTGGVGAAIVFHAACNLLSSFLALGFGLRTG